MLGVGIGSVSGEEVIRAALDVGSGQTKMLVAKVDSQTGGIIEPLFSGHTEVLFGIDWRKSSKGELSQAILSKAKAALRQYQVLARELGASQIAGVATAVFRDAKNGLAFIEEVREELGIDLRVISQEQEGQLGFLTAAAGANQPLHQVVAIDVGSSSFQVSIHTDHGVQVYEGPWGSAKVVGEMVETVQQRSLSEGKSPNPVSVEECRATVGIIQAKLSRASEALLEKLGSQQVAIIGIGGETCLWKTMWIASGLERFTKEEVWGAIERLAGSTDEELSHYPYDWAALAQLLLIYSIMDHLGIPEVQYKPSNGSTPGILMSREFWTYDLLQGR